MTTTFRKPKSTSSTRVPRRPSEQAERATYDVALMSWMLEQAPVCVMFADRDFKIRYINRASLEKLKEVEHLLPVKADQILGQSIDIFHKHPEYQRRILSDPSNLPRQANVQAGNETLELRVSAVRGDDGSYLGAVLAWEVVTKRVALEKDNQENQKKAEALGGILSSVANNAAQLASASEELAVISTQMTNDSEETAVQANVVSVASEQVSSNVQTVASGVEEVNASIREIAANAVQAAKFVEQAVAIAGTTNLTITKLGESSREIGKVIKVITSIAEQTNLLALNATIEAARAGEVGKGFAVVANEVKELAKETARATEDIGQTIEAIQSDTVAAIEAIKQIGTMIDRVNGISSTIASAVEEQAVTTNEISRNIAEAASGSSEITQNIANVAKTAQSTTTGASCNHKAATELARMARELQEIVLQFS